MTGENGLRRGMLWAGRKCSEAATSSTGNDEVPARRAGAVRDAEPESSAE